jgi:hypothetical protein
MKPIIFYHTGKDIWVKVDEKHHRGNDHFLTRFTPHIM